MQPLALAIPVPCPVQPSRRHHLPEKPVQPKDAFCTPRPQRSKAPSPTPLETPKIVAHPSAAKERMAAPPKSGMWSLDVLSEHVFPILNDLAERSADRSSWPMDLDRYFFAMKHQEVKRVRAVFEAALAYAGQHAHLPELEAVLDSDAFGSWLVAPQTTDRAISLMLTPPPEAVVPGALHRLRNAMAQLQVLRSNWPHNL